MEFKQDLDFETYSLSDLDLDWIFILQ